MQQTHVQRNMTSQTQTAYCNSLLTSKSNIQLHCLKKSAVCANNNKLHTCVSLSTYQVQQLQRASTYPARYIVKTCKVLKQTMLLLSGLCQVNISFLSKLWTLSFSECTFISADTIKQIQNIQTFKNQHFLMFLTSYCEGWTICYPGAVKETIKLHLKGNHSFLGNNQKEFTVNRK